MRTWLTICGLLVICSVSLTAVLSADDLPQLFVVNSLSNDVSAIDLQAEALIGAIPLGMRGYDIAVHGNIAYITSAPVQEGKTPPALLVVDLVARQVKDAIPLPISPLATVHVRSAGKQAVVVTAAPPGLRNEQRGQVLFVDVTTKQVAKALNVGLNPLASAITPDGRILYTADWGSRTITVVDLEAARLQDSIPMGMATTRVLAMCPDGRKLYTLLERLPVVAQQTANFNQNIANAQTNVRQQVQTAGDTALWEIDTATNAVEKFPFAGISQALAAAVSPNNQRLYLYGRAETGAQASADQQYTLVSVDVRTKKIVQQYGDFGFLSTLLVSGDGKKLYLVGTPGDPQKEERVQQSYTARNRVAVEPQQQTAQVADTVQDLSRLKKTVTIVDAGTGKVEKVLTVGSFPRGAAIREP
jgi:DNA-binding beta-propeller fold protein YncE